MKKMLCKKTDCFYCAKGQCVSLSVLSTEKCGHFLHKKLSRARPVPHPVNMAALRAQLDAHAPTIGGTRRLSQRQMYI